MERMLRSHGVAATRVPAVTTDSAAVREVLDEFPHKRAGNVACSLSHIEVWRRIVQLPDEHSAALVLEDDVRFIRGWRPQLAACVAAMREAWDVFYLDCSHMSGWEFSRRGLQEATNVVYTDAYLISKAAARRALALFEADDSHDVEGLLLALQDEGRCYTTLPKLALQMWGDSDIQSSARVHGIAHWYATSYHAVFPEELYEPWEQTAEPEEGDDAHDDGSGGGASEAAAVGD